MSRYSLPLLKANKYFVSGARALLFTANGTGTRSDHRFVCPVIDNEFRHDIVKVVCGSTRRSADNFDNVMKKFIVYNRTDA